MLVPDATGACGHFDAASRLCRLHRDGGETMLPASCHHFPRRALLDDRGIFVTLSHFCPTAASLLFDTNDAMTIVTNPAAFPESRVYDGLDARGHWPPLLRPDALFDLGSYARWEQFVVTVLGAGSAIEECLATIATVAEHLRGWSVDRGPLAEWMEAAVMEAHERWRPAATRPDLYRAFEGNGACERIRSFVPEELHARAIPRDVDVTFDRFAAAGWNRFRTPIARYLAAKAFGSWSAYQARGVRTLVAELVATASVLRTECARACGRAERPLDRALLIEAIRASDLLLVHLLDRKALIAWLGQVEHF